MAKRAPSFDWSLLDRESLTTYLWSFAHELVGQDLTIAKFHSKLSKHLKEYMPVKVSKKTDPKVGFSWVYTGGTYYSDYDKARNKCIEIVLVYNPFEEHVGLPLSRYRNMCKTIADTVLHEVIHMRQYRRRKFKDLPDYASTAEKTEKRQEQSYLGNSDEIDAYGFNIACELFDKFGYDRDAAITYLNENQKGLRRKHNCWRMYLKAFDHDHNHPIIHRVKKKVIRYLPFAEMGKPYRNKDWINR